MGTQAEPGRWGPLLLGPSGGAGETGEAEVPARRYPLEVDCLEVDRLEVDCLAALG